MGHVALLPPPVAAPPEPRPSGRRPLPPPPEFAFRSLVLTEPHSLVRGRSATLSVSMLVHVVLIAVVIIVPLVYDQSLPAPDEAVRAFFVAPPQVAPPPPPPPPPAAAARPVPRASAAPRPIEEAKFVAPVEVPEEVKPEESLDLGVEGGVPGGVEGGVPGGVVGGIVGGLPTEAPPSKPAVRVGGSIKQPKLLVKVDPAYPPLAMVSRAQALLILEAVVDTRGHVTTVRVLRGHPLFDDVAMEAVKKWRYQPLLLNGVPNDFILTVTLVFNLRAAEQGGVTP